MNNIVKVFQGAIIHSLSVSKLEILPSALLGISEEGKISFLEPTENLNSLIEKYKFTKEKIIELKSDQFLIPGFVDSHIHAPQYVFTGTGTDLPLLEWLEKYTFPRETKYSDLDFAKDVYQKLVETLIKRGTTTACYFSTIHVEATDILSQIIKNFGQRALVGKVNMDRNSPDYYIEKTQDSIRDTKLFIQNVKKLNSPLITPIITPRFVPTCTSELMENLGKIAEEENLAIQSHISENLNEIEWVKELHPDCKDYASVYLKYNLFNEKTIMAHAVHLTESEIDLVKEKNVGISHCPISNFTLSSGVLNVRKIIDKGIKVGLGSGNYISELSLSPGKIVGRSSKEENK